MAEYRDIADWSADDTDWSWAEEAWRDNAPLLPLNFGTMTIDEVLEAGPEGAIDHLLCDTGTRMMFEQEYRSNLRQQVDDPPLSSADCVPVYSRSAMHVLVDRDGHRRSGPPDQWDGSVTSIRPATVAAYVAVYERYLIEQPPSWITQTWKCRDERDVFDKPRRR